MYPIIFRVGDYALQSYVLLISLSFFLGLGVWIWHGKKYHFKIESQVNLALISFLAGLIGARLLAVLTQLKRYLNGELNIAALWEGGIVYLGGFLLAFWAFLTFAPKFGFKKWQALDTAAPALCFAHALGRVGCFLNGCCFGSVCDLPWAVTYSNPLSVAPQGLPLHPSQLYESFGLIILGFLLIRQNNKPWTKLPTFKVYLLGYGILRFLVEMTRGDLLRGVILGLSTSQWLSVGLILAALSLDFGHRKDHNLPHEN